MTYQIKAGQPWQIEKGSHYDDREVYNGAGECVGILVGTTLPCDLGPGVQGWSRGDTSDIPAQIWKYDDIDGWYLKDTGYGYALDIAPSVYPDVTVAVRVYTFNDPNAPRNRKYCNVPGTPRGNLDRDGTR